MMGLLVPALLLCIVVDVGVMVVATARFGLRIHHAIKTRTHFTKMFSWQKCFPIDQCRPASARNGAVGDDLDGCTVVNPAAVHK